VEQTGAHGGERGVDRRWDDDGFATLAGRDAADGSERDETTDV